MQKHPLLTVKQAAEVLRLEERSVRERLINGQLKGEKKQVGLREKWFVYSGSVEAALSKQQGMFADDPMGIADVAIEGVAVESPDTSDRDGVTEGEAAPGEWLNANREKIKALAEEIVKPLMEKIESQQEVIFEQKQLIAEQGRQLRLLPDLQKQAEQGHQEVELKHVENEALKKQIAAMAEEKDALQAQVEAAKGSWWRKLFGF